MELKSTLTEILKFTGGIQRQIWSVEESANLKTGQWKLSRFKESKQSLRVLWDTIKQTNIHIVGVPEAEAREKGAERILEEIMAGASLVAQWLRICLPMQGTRVRALVRGDPTCRRATKPMHHNYWACALESVSHNYWAHVPRARAPQQEKPQQWEARAPQWRHNTAINK